MAMPRASDTGKDFFRELVCDYPGVTVRPMFANLGAFVNGWMFAAVIGDTVGVKLRDEDVIEEARSSAGATGFGPGQTPLRDYVGFALNAPREVIAEWIETAYFETSALPPKPGKG